MRRGNPPGHIRTPYYIRGKAGIVERICGEFRNPEELAYGRDGEPKQVLYRVRFRTEACLAGLFRPGTATRIDVELYEHWLEPPH